MRFLLAPEPSLDLDALAEQAHAAHAAGLDGVLLTDLLAAAAVAPRVPDLLLAAEVELGARHPFEVAEEAAVVDLASGGRLIVVARPAPGAEEHFAEALDLVRTALTPRPFRFEGRRWRVPANLPENVYGQEPMVRLTPAPAQVRVEIWGASGGREAALARGLGYLADADADAGELGSAYAALGPAAIGAPRARRDVLDDGLVERLRTARETFGQDWAVVAGDAMTIGTQVRPRVQLHRLNPKLEELWAQ
jgi:alkanesulfonate monooxygenase SsuD/methylene tetrahydromethanopterin reductase-like flavin-dependent oxidoreductase (luciferase family)